MFGFGDRRERAAARWLARMANESAAFDRAAFEQWRNAHPGNGKAFDEAARSWTLDLPVEATRYAQASRGSAATGLATPQRRWAGPALALAATLLLCLGAIGIGIFGPFADTGRPEVRIASPLVTRHDETRSFRLSDGSLVKLGPNSELAIAFSINRRALRLMRGTARFDVAHDATRPFEVAAGDALVMARGTVFAVRMTPDGARVALYRGAIDVERLEAGRRTGAVRKLAPGQFIDIRFESPPEAAALLGKAAPQAATVTFEQTPVAEAIAAFEARTGVEILIDPRLRTETISGGFAADDAQGFAAMLATMFDLTVTRTAGGDLKLSARR